MTEETWNEETVTEAVREIREAMLAAMAQRYQYEQDSELEHLKRVEEDPALKAAILGTNLPDTGNGQEFDNLDRYILEGVVAGLPALAEGLLADPGRPRKLAIADTLWALVCIYGVVKPETLKQVFVSAYPDFAPVSDEELAELQKLAAVLRQGRVSWSPKHACFRFLLLEDAKGPGGDTFTDLLEIPADDRRYIPDPDTLKSYSSYLYPVAAAGPEADLRRTLAVALQRADRPDDLPVILDHIYIGFLMELSDSYFSELLDEYAVKPLLNEGDSSQLEAAWEAFQLAMKRWYMNGFSLKDVRETPDLAETLTYEPSELVPFAELGL